jgi:hypothetical protein
MRRMLEVLSLELEVWRRSRIAAFFSLTVIAAI